MSNNISAAVATAPRTSRGERRRIIVSSLLGNTVEWFDFYIYGISAALFFPTIFFPSDSQLVGTLASFGTLAGGFLIRPVGGLIGGHIGDRYGRKKVLVASMVLMGGSTVVVGLLPGYDIWGVWAAVLLIIARLLQGIGAGAEYGGSVLMITEHFDSRRRGFWASLGNTGVFAGGVFATLTFAIITRFPAEQQEYLWRVPFIASALLVGVGLWIRLGVSETPAFKASIAKRVESAAPFVDMMRRYKGMLLIVVVVATAASLPYQIYVTFGTAYTRAVDGNVSHLLNSQTIIGFMALAMTPMFGYLSDRVGRKPLMAAGIILMIPAVYFLFSQINGQNQSMILLALVLCEVGHCMAYGPLAAFLAEHFDTRTRYTGVSMGYQICGALAGLAPLGATAILKASGGAPNVGWVPITLVVTGVLGIVALVPAKEMAGKALTE
ncbi:MFS transporter [Rhodococcus sp. NPDC127530]|uniref:MFS transporter n=1 Tax=unclassified Rhodococcus (in: high G+C Gram-positive bacteria) TaxID=192944 RepID=UPI0036457BC8